MPTVPDPRQLAAETITLQRQLVQIPAPLHFAKRKTMYINSRDTNRGKFLGIS